jgi:hypothetical protein
MGSSGFPCHAAIQVQKVKNYLLPLRHFKVASVSYSGPDSDDLIVVG